MIERPSFTIGIEEEYLIVSRETRDLVVQPTPEFRDALIARLGERVASEYLQCQVEVGTAVHLSVGAATAELGRLRRTVAETAEAYGYAAIAASTHPFAKWREQAHTRKPRYDALHHDLGLAVRRMLICGCHVHVGIEDPDLRIDLMNQVSYFLPHLLALSCSSPFWEGEDTGLASYRLTVFDALPRTGLPDRLESFAEYRRMVNHLVVAGCLEDATKIWWDIRPSDKFPTLEQRVTDVCSLVTDTAAIAAIFQATLGFLFRLRARNQRWRIYPSTLIAENRWRAQRYGSEGRLVDHGQASLAPLCDLLEELFELIGPDADGLGCHREVLHARGIAVRGTSATRQRQVYASAVQAGAHPEEALVAVVDALIAEFTTDCAAAEAPSGPETASAPA